MGSPKQQPLNVARTKILFVMFHGGFARHYLNVLRALATNGCHIHVALEVNRNKVDENVWLEELVAQHPSITAGMAPARERSTWAVFAEAVRLYLDYLRYFDPRFEKAVKARQRVESQVARPIVWAARLLALVAVGAAAWLMRGLTLVERIIRTDPAVDAYLAAQRPDLILVTPLVDVASTQVDYIKSARRLGIRTGLCVASWDNLTNKGLMRAVPDRVFVWNEAQKMEAVSFHGAAPDQVVVTGAQTFDEWFGCQPSRSREEFCRTVGLSPDRPYILYLGSSYFIAPEEGDFVESWIRAVRGAEMPALSGAGILVRPHPLNPLGIDRSPFDNVAVWPPPGASRADAQDRADYFHALFYSSIVVGVNTTALIEAGIVGRPVFTLLAPNFRHSQEGTLHFRHLVEVNGGLLHVSQSMEQHLEQLDRGLRGMPDAAGRARGFVEAFVRPHGLDVPAAPILTRAIEAALQQPAPPPTAATLATRALRMPLLPIAHLVVLLQDARQRTPWVYARPFIAAAVYLASVVYWVRDLLMTVARSLRRSAYRLSKRARRSGWVAWYESGQYLARLLARSRKRSRKAQRHAIKTIRRGISRVRRLAGLSPQ